MIKDELGLGKLVERLRAWLVKRGQPDSGMHYQSNAAHGLSRVELYAADADFVARHFHGSGAVSLADALTALIAERDALAKRLDHYIGMHGVNIRTGRRLVLRERARAEAAEAQLKAAREVLEAFVTNFAGMEDGDGNEAPELALARSTLNLTVNHDG